VLCPVRRGAARRGETCAHHRLGHLARRGLARHAGADVATMAQDRGGVAERADFLQLVRYVKDRHPLGCELAQGGEKDLHLLRREHAGRLVHDQEARRLQQAADDLDPLPLSRRQIAGDARGIERQAIGLRHLAYARGECAHRRWMLHPQRHILGHRERIEEREMLKHHRHPRRPRRRRIGRRVGRAAQAHRAAIGFDEAVYHLDQRGLARAILAQERVDLALADIERHGIIGDHARIGLGEAIDAEQRRGHARLSPPLGGAAPCGFRDPRPAFGGSAMDCGAGGLLFPQGRG